MGSHLLITTKNFQKIKIYHALKLSDIVVTCILLINVKVPTRIGILTFISMIIFMLSEMSMRFSITSRPG